MPSYRTHISVNLTLGLPIGLAALKYTVSMSLIDAISFAIAFVYGTFFLHPDLDLARQTRLFSLKGLLTFPFRFYSYLFRHRGISHAPILGTFTRVFWLAGFISFMMYCFDWTVPSVHLWEESCFWFAIAGVATADLSHILLDLSF